MKPKLKIQKFFAHSRHGDLQNHSRHGDYYMYPQPNIFDVYLIYITLEHCYKL